MTAGPPTSRIDTGKPHPARVYDWLLGGEANCPATEWYREEPAPENERSGFCVGVARVR
ncbi:SAM-dependent methyltransferase [Streptomyces yanii]|uniref:SAM-dependent methyltransferase n=1 Tax=Streptomyces yanii TaxID=78510 RepID=A0ABV5RBQ9_9ACTN